MGSDMSSTTRSTHSALQYSGHEAIASKAPRPERLIGFAEVQSRVGLSRSSVWRLERSGSFPRSVPISPGRRAWRESDLDRWIEARLAAVD